MTEILNLEGYIRGVTYQTFLQDSLETVSLNDFDVNQAKPYGLIRFDSTEIAFSKWVSPKRTRSYPFARIYNTYNSNKVITIIPVIKDEGKDGDRDRIQYSTISWMNLLNIYIVLAYYESAEKSQKKGQVSKNKLTNQKFNNDFVKEQIQEILKYKQSALHWNKNLFEQRFTEIFGKALDRYDSIAQNTGVLIHSRQKIQNDLNRIIAEFEEFKNISLKGSQSASKREALTAHEQEYLVDGKKGTFSIENYLGGVYFLTPDEIFCKNNIYVIQESKNTLRKTLPSKSDIKDGLFKLILYSNLDSITINNKEIEFISQLKSTSNKITGSILLPENYSEINLFFAQNNFSFREKETIKQLVIEAKNNKNISIEISSIVKKKILSKSLKIKSPLRYPGGKSKSINKIAELLPKNFTEFREPFVGGGSVFIYLKQQYPELKIWINDLNPELFLFWKIAQSNLTGLVQEIFNIKTNYSDGKKLFQELTKASISELSELERAIRFFVLNRITFSGTVESGGFSQQAFAKRFTYSSIERLEKLEFILPDVKITNLDYRYLLNSCNHETFLFLDPPYFTATKSKLYGKRGELHTSFNHNKFSDEIKKCYGNWLITYDNCPEIRSNFSFANIQEWEVQYGMNNYKQDRAAKGQELFISNYRINQKSDKSYSKYNKQLSLF